MSLFLGKIHHWLYSKILWYEAAENEIVRKAGERGEDIASLLSRIYAEYGSPAGGRPLEEIIDTSNIHGWLQSKIESAELRQGALVTELLQRRPEYKAEISEIFISQGRSAAKEYPGNAEAPEDVFEALNDYILEGMPCDRPNVAVASDEQEYAWETTVCLHQPYWTRVGGDVQNFYDFRAAWIKAFVETINAGFTYLKDGNGVNRIVVKGKAV